MQLRIADSVMQILGLYSPVRGRDVRKIGRKLMQVATGITTFAAEEGAEFKEIDVAT